MTSEKKIKQYWNRKPCNIGFSKSKLFSKKYFDEVTKKKYFVEGHIKNFVDFKKWKNKKVLEIGFGIGTDACEFIKNGANYTGIELSNKSYEILKKRINVYKLNKYKPKLILGSALNLTKHFKSKKNKFDLIYSWGVLHHTSSLQKAANQIKKISNKNTEIRIMLYAKNSYKNYMLDITNYRYEAQANVPKCDRVDMKDVKSIFSGFKIINSYQDFIFPYKIKPYKNNIYKKINHFDVMPTKIFKRLESVLGEHLMITMKLK